MSHLSLKARLNLLFLSAILLPVLLVFIRILVIAGSISSNIDKSDAVFNYISQFKFELALLFALSVTLGLICIYINKTIFKPLAIISKAILQIRNGAAPTGLDSLKKGELGEIARVINDLAVSLEQGQNQLEAQSFELAESNISAKELNTKIELLCSRIHVLMLEMKELENRYSALENKIPEVVLVVDGTGAICIVDQVCSELLGYKREDLIGLNISELIDLKLSGFSFEETYRKLSAGGIELKKLKLIRNDRTRVTADIEFAKEARRGLAQGIRMVIRDTSSNEIIKGKADISDFLQSIQSSVALNKDLNEICRYIAKEICIRLRYPFCILGLFNQNGISIKVKAFTGKYVEGIISDRMLSWANMLLDRYPSERMTVSSEVLDENEGFDSWFVKKINNGKNEKLKELLYIPLGNTENKLGVMAFGITEASSQAQINLLCSVAGSVAATIENAVLYESGKKHFVNSINALVATIEAKDKYTEGHSLRVSKYTACVAEKLELSKEQINDIRIAGILHDIGKIGINDNILLKPGKLTSDEYEEIKRHPSISNRILHHIGFSERALNAVAYHHERYDGKGYPFGIAGEDISLEAQIIAVADAYDAMTSRRPYREPMSCDEAFSELIANKRTQFNPKVVDAFLEVREKIENLQKSA
ncbi:MAG: HD domain-containing protein [Bacillota bacterium]|nr:HD domain-containing protein [Bacillota bacterium]